MYVKGGNARFECHDCLFSGNQALALGSPASDTSHPQHITAAASNGSQVTQAMIEQPSRLRSGLWRGAEAGRCLVCVGPQVYGGAVYVGEGNLSLLSPRWRSNRAHCAASLGSACTHDADDVRPNTQPTPSPLGSC